MDKKYSVSYCVIFPFKIVIVGKLKDVVQKEE